LQWNILHRFDWDTAESAAGRFAQEHDLSDKLHNKLIKLLAQKLAAYE